MHTQVSFSRRSHRSARAPLVVSIAVLLSGCWMPPTGSVRPGGPPRVIADRIEVEPVVAAARVAAVDRRARTVVLSLSGMPPRAFKVGSGVRNWGDIHGGDQVRATIKEILTVYVPPAGESGSAKVSRNARVLLVDPSYRLLTVQDPNGGTETFKIRLHTRMQDIEAGDSVAIRTVEVVELRVR